MIVPTAATTATTATAATVGHGEGQAGAIVASHAEAEAVEEFAGVVAMARRARGRDISQSHGPFFFKYRVTFQTTKIVMSHILHQRHDWVSLLHPKVKVTATSTVTVTRIN